MFHFHSVVTSGALGEIYARLFTGALLVYYNERNAARVRRRCRVFAPYPIQSESIRSVYIVMNVLSEKRPFSARTCRASLEIFDLETGEARVVKEYPYCVEAPNWTKDGHSLIYNAKGRLFKLDLNTLIETAIDTGFADRCNNDHVLSPDNARIAISHATAEDGLSRIYVLPLTGGTPALITPIAPSYLHGWSPDGSTLAYCAERNGRYNIYTLPAEGGEETRLTDGAELSDGPEYAPDGKRIWFNSARSGRMQLYRMDADGKAVVQMTDDGRNNWFPHVSPDGQSVCYISYDGQSVAPGDHPANKDVELRLLPAQGGTPQTLLALFGGQGTLNVNSWSPDSKRFAFVRYAL